MSLLRTKGPQIDMCIVVEKTSDFNSDNSFRFSWTITKLPEGEELGNLSHVSYVWGLTHRPG